MKGVYLIHFERPYKHAQHYIGYAADIDKRLAKHSSGNGARLIKVIQDHGIEWCVVKIWKDKGRDFERKLKKQKNAWRHCPICLMKRRRT